MLAVDVFEQTLYMVFLLYCAGVINVPSPAAWRIGGGSQSLNLKHLHEHVGDDQWFGRSHHHPEHKVLLVILTLEFEIGGVQTEGQ